MFKQEMMKFWDWDLEIGNGWHACSVPTNFSPFYYLPENKFLPLLLFAGEQIVANGSTLHWERRRKKRKQIPNWRRRKTNSFLRHPKIWVHFWSFVNMHGLNGILYALGAKNLITLFSKGSKQWQFGFQWKTWDPLWIPDFQQQGEMKKKEKKNWIDKK